MRVIRTSDYRRMPWKNGGGETTEIAAAPAGASLDAFDWRVSMAHVGVSGPFSVFPEIDRTLAVLGPAAILLDFGGRGSVRLDRASAPYGFPADCPVEGRLIDGPVDDLNVMTRRGRFRHHVSRRRIEGSVSLARRGDAMIVIPVEAGMAAIGAGRFFALGAGDALITEASDPPGAIELRPEHPADVFVIDLWRIEAP